MKHTNKLLLFFSLLISCDKVEELQKVTLIGEQIKDTEMTLTIPVGSVQADGKTFSVVTLTITTTNKSLIKNKSVTFDISPVGKFSNGSTSISIALDLDGKAVAYVSSIIEGKGTIKAKVDDAVRTGSIDFTKVNVPSAIDTLVLTVSKNDVLADNYSYAEINATSKDPTTLAKTKTIKFTTDKGSFSNDLKEITTNIGLDNVAKAYLKYNKPELVRVTATISNTYTKELFVKFVPALPDQIFIEPKTINLSSKLPSNSEIVARLVRSTGLVSDGQVVIFYDSTATNKSIGTFFNTTKSNTSGEATAQYSLQDSTYKGFVYIKGYVNDGAKKILGVNRILIK